MKRHLWAPALLVLTCGSRLAQAQPFDITMFDPTSKGAWSERGRTTLVVPKVPNGSIQLDAATSAAEYGGFQAVTVTPGVNAWILDFPADRVWDGEDDSGFSFWLAHDDDHLYVGVHVQDETVFGNDPNSDFWKDDAIEIVVDALSDRFDNNTDSSQDSRGGHCYLNYEGRFSAWDEAAGQISGTTWATGVNWTYGASGDVFGFGKAVAGGWQVEVRFHKRLFEDPAVGNRLKDGYRLGFNLGLDDDDQQGPGGSAVRSEESELQYFWANRERWQGYTADLLATLTPEQLASKSYLFDGSVTTGVVDAAGRLSHGGSGELFLAYDTPATGKILWVTSNGASPINADASLIALLQARGYTVTVFTADASTPEGLRDAAAGQDVVIISETIGSTSVLDPAGDGLGVLSLKDTDIPIIAFEAYMYDNADWVTRTADGSNDFVNWGNTGRSEVDPLGPGDARDSLYIRDSAHPIAGGLAGKQAVYRVLYSLNFAKPSADAHVVASVDPDGAYPTIFVYEKGDKLPDGSTAPNKRIGFFLGQAANPTANWSLDYADLTETGKTLLFNTINYTLPTKPVPTLSIGREAGKPVITYSGGTLQSATEVTGAVWSDELTLPSGSAIEPAGARKFYRVRQ